MSKIYVVHERRGDLVTGAFSNPDIAQKFADNASDASYKYDVLALELDLYTGNRATVYETARNLTTGEVEFSGEDEDWNWETVHDPGPRETSLYMSFLVARSTVSQEHADQLAREALERYRATGRVTE
jgi:hypothetical protein